MFAGNRNSVINNYLSNNTIDPAMNSGFTQHYRLYRRYIQFHWITCVCEFYLIASVLTHLPIHRSQVIAYRSPMCTRSYITLVPSFVSVPRSMSRHNVALKPRPEISREGSCGSTFHLQVRGDPGEGPIRIRISMIDLSQRHFPSPPTLLSMQSNVISHE